MGMFDYLRVEAELPGDWRPDDDCSFQTKDLDCELSTHTITADGRLLRQRVTDITEVPKAERTYPDAPEDSIRALAGSLHFHRVEEEDREFHGFIEFGGVEKIGTKPVVIAGRSWDQPVYRHHDYRAKFTDGRLVRIEKLPEWKPPEEAT